MKTIISLLALLITITGCSVKNNDETGVKVAKHIINSPIYVVGAVGGAGVLVTSMVGGGIAYGTSKAGDAIIGSELYWGETYIGKKTEEVLDKNSSLAKFYTDSSFALYKNNENESFMLLKDSGEFIKSSDEKFTKRTAVAKLEGRPHLHIAKYMLPEGVDEDLIYEKIKKDRFGNPVFFGDNVLLYANEFRNGLLMTLKTNIYIIRDGANTVDMADTRTVDSLNEQIIYYFASSK